MSKSTIVICDHCGIEIKEDKGFQIWEEDGVLHINPRKEAIEVTVEVKDICTGWQVKVLVDEFLDRDLPKAIPMPPQAAKYEDDIEEDL